MQPGATNIEGDFTSVPGRRASRSSASASVVPLKTVVKSRKRRPVTRALNFSSTSASRRTPPTVTKATMASIRSAVASSLASSRPSAGSARLRVSNVDVDRGVVGRTGRVPLWMESSRLPASARLLTGFCRDGIL